MISAGSLLRNPRRVNHRFPARRSQRASPFVVIRWGKSCMTAAVRTKGQKTVPLD
jgi:hypothetical protein